MSKYWFIICFCSTLFVGCADSSSDQASETDANAAEEGQPQSDNSNLEEANTGNVDATQTETVTPSAQGEVALNPPHGQPGHDCAIAVGAPLDGSGAQNTQTAQPNFNPPASNQKPIMQVGDGGSTRVNPPHGQPGHDCDIAVGAPLPAK